ncbi:peptidoglycan-binding domain-containing protein [Cryptosporangium arvum]|uniref:Putative peptidoglycan-binding domain-containing protein n=1 Tax=Cryptosporangium arvum DSM 44712 TaxID=927661 RepID=A0A011AGG8_9ACTN|nr:peptidoglycan-binding domain-containing protein [Cryptosporangium arvum]EXG81111.1 putative peptidoglycan-binding domain-containing protein [Cryptosporangium arvum DSM 44712]
MTVKRKIVGRTLALLIATVAALATGGVVATPASAGNITGRCTYTSSEPVLRSGSSGTAVRQVQCELNYAMTGVADIAVDGSFGPITDNYVRRFQSCIGLPVDGIVGPNTWKQLNHWAASVGFPC